MYKYLMAIVFLFITSLWTIAAQAGQPVFVSILPQKFFVERLAGDLVDVSVMVAPGASPATYEPTPGQMAELSDSKVYFAIGVPFEAVWLDRIAATNEGMAVVHVDESIDKIPMAAHSHDHEEHAEHEGHDHAEAEHDEHGHDHAEAGHEEHEHEHAEAGHEEHDHEHEGHDHAEAEHDEHGHEHGFLDPHVWLGLDEVRIVAANTCQGLISMDSDNQSVYEANLAEFLKEIDALDEQITSILAEVPEDKRIFMVFHPVWGYLAKKYGLTQVAIESQGKEPGPRELAEIIEHGKENKVSVVFVQPQFSDKSARVIASELNAQVVGLDPLALDWSDNLIKVVNAFAQALK